MLEHCDSNSILIVSGRSDEESMQEFIDDSFHS